jgi:hypothetical protein
MPKSKRLINYNMSDPCEVPQPFRNNRFSIVFGKPEMKVIEPMITAVNIPALAMPEAVTVSRNREGWVPGDKISYGQMTVSFILDENLANYKAVYAWMLQNRNTQTVFMGDVTVTIYSGKNNPLMTIRFPGTFPVSLSDIPLSAQETDPQPVIAQMVLQFDRMEVISDNVVIGEERR